MKLPRYPWFSVGQASELCATRLLRVERVGIKFAVILDSQDQPRAYIAVCPHAWVPIPNFIQRNGCLVCPLHGAKFDQSSGIVVDAKGKRIRQPLRAVAVIVRGEQVMLRIGPDCFAFVVYATAKRLLRDAAHFRKHAFGAGKRR